MPRETNAAKRERAVEVCERLNRRYGPVECFLDHENPFSCSSRCCSRRRRPTRRSTR